MAFPYLSLTRVTKPQLNWRGTPFLGQRNYAGLLLQKQRKQLQFLLYQGGFTQLGQQYGLARLSQHVQQEHLFRSQVPVSDYNAMYNEWWHRAYQHDAANITWPGHTPYYALSSGTSQAASKYIPVTHDMLRAMRRGSRRLFITTMRMPELPIQHFTKKVLMVGSCTHIQRESDHYTGDLSGIIGANSPAWLAPYYLPNRQISDMPDWGQRIDAIVQQAPHWDVGTIVGNPAWVLMIFEQILERYGLEHIHQMWKNLNLYIHSGVFFEPYRPNFEAMLGRRITTLDSYLASEGFFGFQPTAQPGHMQLMGDCGVFFEFIPFNEQNFDDEGNLKSRYPETHILSEIQPNQPYAMVITTVSGAWRYLLGDVVQFTDVRSSRFQITGRTKQSLSVCGEHLSIDNLSMAIQQVQQETGIAIGEFSVAGLPSGTGWKHQWWISTAAAHADANQLAVALDQALCRLNDDYATERRYSLHHVDVSLVPRQYFFDWLQQRGKMNGQAKIPRVLKGDQLRDFQAFLHARLTTT
jgi:GH3 auxin-responsive promoter